MPTQIGSCKMTWLLRDEAIQTLEARMNGELADHAKTRAALQSEIVTRHTAENNR